MNRLELTCDFDITDHPLLSDSIIIRSHNQEYSLSFELCSAKEVDHFPNEVEGLAFVWKIERYNNVVASGYLLPSSYCATFSSRFVFVSPNYRRRGLYTSVLKTVAAYADIISCSKVEGRQTADAESVWLSMECERENAVGKDKFILRRSQ